MWFIHMNDFEEFWVIDGKVSFIISHIEFAFLVHQHELIKKVNSNLQVAYKIQGYLNLLNTKIKDFPGPFLKYR